MVLGVIATSVMYDSDDIARKAAASVGIMALSLFGETKLTTCVALVLTII